MAPVLSPPLWEQIMSNKFAALFSIVLLVSACASAPAWKGMSEDEIASWKAMSVEPAAAQEWRKGGFTPYSAEAWMRAGFKAENAVKWAAEKFTAEEAQNWRVGGFSLDQAVENRGKGLTPVK
jgi:hypothetical protein